MDLDKEIKSPFTSQKVIEIDTSLYQSIIDGMETTVSYGTAKKAFIPDLSFCGKTGTSQNPSGEDHSVFFGFAPKENPKIAIAVYLENAGSGGAVAAPLASLIVEKYLNGEIKRDRIENAIKLLNMRKTQ